MSSTFDRPASRRQVLGHLATSAAVLVSAACAAPPAGANPAQPPAPRRPGAGSGQTTGTDESPSASRAAGSWDDSWFARLTAQHKAVFDSPAIDGGLVQTHVTNYLSGMRSALGVEAQAVLVVRHEAIPMILNSAMWLQYGLGEVAGVKGRQGEAWATQNPYTRGFTTLAARGVVFLGCDLALHGRASDVAESARLTADAVYQEFARNLIPGFILQPNGIYAVNRAQEAGCTFTKST